MTPDAPDGSTATPPADIVTASSPAATTPTGPGTSISGAPDSVPHTGDTPAVTRAPMQNPAAATMASKSAIPSPLPKTGGQRAEMIGARQKLLEGEEVPLPEGILARPGIGPDSLVVEGLLRVLSQDGVVIRIPVNTFLPGALTPTAAHIAQQQFGMVLEQLVTQPAMTAFTALLESVNAKRQTGKGETNVEAVPENNEHMVICRAEKGS